MTNFVYRVQVRRLARPARLHAARPDAWYLPLCSVHRLSTSSWETRVDLLELVMAQLLRLYPAEAAERWLLGLNPSLGGRRPVDLIRRGRVREVLDAIANERAGGFA